MSVMSLIGFAATMKLFNDIKDFVLTEGDGWIVATNVEYAVAVEFGTSDTSAYPYFRPGTRKALRKFPQIADDADSVDDLIQNLALEIEAQIKAHMKHVEATTNVPWRHGGHLIDTAKLINSIEAEKL